MAHSPKKSLRYLWSHEHPVHRAMVRAYNAVVRRIPFGLKYKIGLCLRAKKYPYRLVNPGSVVVQVGAPRDTLLAGRSRAMYFCLLAGEGGHVYVIEPDDASISEFTSVARENGISNFTLMATAAWSEKTTLTIYLDEKHPAANFSVGSKNYDDERMQEYRAMELPADTIDSLLVKCGAGKVNLVSITTNGAEPEILQGMKQTIADGLPYVGLALTGNNYVDLMRKYGFELMAYDDRGLTFGRRN